MSNGPTGRDDREFNIAEVVPIELQERRQWLVWKTDQRDGKPTKVPYIAGTQRRASSTDPETWCTFQEAVDAHSHGSYDGIGFVFAEDDGLCGIDLDKCANGDRELEPWAQEIVSSLDSYTELSPSGKGLHIIVRATLPGRQRRKGKIEMYDRGRYFTFTGRHLDGTPNTVHRRQTEIEALHQKIFKPATDSEPAARPQAPTNLDDRTLLQKAMSASNGAKFTRLWEGDWSAYPSQSEADQALCNIFAFWTGGDAAQMDRLFRQSGLMRGKWDRPYSDGSTYGSATVEKAVAGATDFYSPGYPMPEPPPDLATHPAPDTKPAQGTTMDIESCDRHLLSLSPDDEGNAQSVRYLHGARFWHTEAYGWLHYTGTHWERQSAESKLERAIVSTLIRRRHLAVDAEKDVIVKAAKPSAHNVRSVKFLLTSLLTATIADFDQSPDHLNVKNGVLNLRTGDLEPHHSGQLFTYCLPIEYDPEADTAAWEAWLTSAVGDDEAAADYLQKAVGYSLTGNTWEECLFYLHGPTRAGKGTFTETLLAMAGREPVATETDFETFTRKRDSDANNADLATLKPCRVVVASESAKNQWLNAAKLKQLTGGNLVYCALKYRNHFSYRPQFAIWLVSNHPPKIDVDDDAAWGRVRLIRFPNSYLGREDKSLKAKMIRPGNLQAVLTWAVRGAMMWFASGGRGIEAPPSVEQATSQARERIDYVGQWLTEEVVSTGDDNDFVSNPTLYSCYKDWCEANGVRPKQQTALTQALRGKGFKAGERKKIGGKTYRGCRGIKLR